MAPRCPLTARCAQRRVMPRRRLTPDGKALPNLAPQRGPPQAVTTQLAGQVPPIAEGDEDKVRQRCSRWSSAPVIRRRAISPRSRESMMSSCCNRPCRPPTIEIRAARFRNGQPPPARRYRPRGVDSGGQMAMAGASPIQVAPTSEKSTPMARAASAAGRATALRFLQRQPRPWLAASARRYSCKAGRPPNGGGGHSLRGSVPQSCPASSPTPAASLPL